MGEATAAAAVDEAKVEAPAATPASAERKAQVQTLLADILRLMEFPAKLELKDMPDGGIGVAVHFEGELPGITPGKRSYLVDCIQFLVNKALNRPNVERRWVSLGVNAFPEPRGPKEKPHADEKAPPKPSAPPAEAKKGPEPKADKKDAKKDKRDKKGDDGRKGGKGHDAGEVDEHTLEVSEDPALTALAKELTDKAQRLGRPYAVLMLGPEDRARLLQAAKGAEGVTVKAEGKKHLRRVAFVPHKLTPMPRRHFMADDDEEE